MNEEKKFQELAQKWRAETSHLSRISHISMNQYYQNIIGMGPAAIPLILKDLKENGPDHWFWALTAITCENPLTEDIAGNMKAMTEAWIQWGIKKGFI